MSVRLSAANLLAAGARFEVKNAQKQIVETWNMQTGEDGVDEHTLTTEPADLRNCFLQWRINTCSMHAGSDQGRNGVAIEWMPRVGWSLVGERYEEERTQFLRAGIRVAVTDAWTVDMSRTHSLSGSGQSRWTLGTSWQFGRP